MDEFEKALAEQDEFDKALAEQGPVQVADTSSQAAAPFDPNQWQGGFNDLGVKLPEQAPYADVGEHIVGGLEQAGRDLLTPDVTVPTSVTEALNTSMTALPVLKLGQFGLDAASAVVQPLKQRYIDPPIRAAQDAARKYDEQELARRGIQGPEQYGPAGEQAFRNLVSMVYGDPARYQTPEKQAAGTSALAAAGEKALSFDQPNFKSSAIPEASLAGAFANTATAEFAYLPLYLVDGLGKSAAMKGATGGFLSDLVDPREGANPVNAALMGAGIGGAFEEAPRLAKKAGSAVKATAETFTEKVFKKVLGDLRGGSYLPEIKRAPTVARVKPLDIHRLVESAPTGGKITGKPTATVLDVDANGDLFAKSVSLQKEGPVVAEVAADKAGAKGEVTVATRRVADKLAAEGKPLPKNMVIADDAEELMAKTKVTGPGDLQPGDVMTGGMLGQADELIGQQVQKMEARGTFQPGMKDRAGNLLVGDGEVVGLHQLPQTDELIFWDNGLGPGRAERLSARDIHVAALDARNVVEVMTPEGPRLGVVREVREGQALVAPFDPAERIDRNLMEPVVVKVGEARALTDKQGRATRTLTEALDARDAAIAREAEELQAFIDETAAQFDALPSPNPTLASQVGPSPMPPDGKTGSLVADMAAVESKTVLDAPETTAIIAATSPPVLPGTPPPPPGVPPGVAGAMPPNSNLNARTVEEIAKLPPRTRALFMPPTADGPLIASSAAAAMRGAQNLESMLPRFIQAVKQTVTPRLLKETPGRQKLFNTLAREYLTSRSANPMKLLNEFPEIMADFEVHADDLRRGLAANEAELIALNWLDNPQTPAAPAGMKKFMDDLFADQLYVPDMYMFGELDKGEWSRMLKSREDIRAQGVRDYINQVLRPKYGSSKGEVAMKLEAEMQIDRFIGDPEAWALDNKLPNAVSSDPMRAKRAPNLEVMLTTFAQYVKPKTIAEAASLRKYVTGKGGSIPQTVTDPKDIKFLNQLRDEFAEAVPQWQRKVMGEIRDPLTLAPAGLVNQMATLERARAFQALKTHQRLLTVDELDAVVNTARADLQMLMTGNHPQKDALIALHKADLEKYGITLSDVVGKEKVKWVALPDNPAFGPYSKTKNGGTQYVVHPEYQGIMHADEGAKLIKHWVHSFLSGQLGGAVGRGVGKAAAVTAWGQVVGNPSAWATTLLGTLSGQARSGSMVMFSPKYFRTTAEALKQWHAYKTRPMGGDGAEWIRKGIRYGTVASDWMHAEGNFINEKLAKEMLANPDGTGMTMMVKAAAAKVSGAYSGFEAVMKHASFLGGIEKGGVDIKTGKLVDRKAAVDYIVGFGKATSVDFQKAGLQQFPDDKLVELVEKASARDIAESFEQADRTGEVSQTLGALGQATVGTGINRYVRAFTEEVRTNAMILPRIAKGRPGVRGNMAVMAAIGASMYTALQLRKKMEGLTEADEDKAYQSLPSHVKQNKPLATTISRQDANGRYTMVDLARLYGPLRWVQAGAYGQSPLQDSPTGLASNILVNGIGRGVLGQTSLNFLKDLGVKADLLRPEPNYTPAQPGALNALGDVASGVLPLGVQSAIRGVRGGDMLPAMTGGVLFKSGTPQDAALNAKFQQRDEKKMTRPPGKVAGEGKPSGLFDTKSREARIEEVKENRELVKQRRQNR